jgi:DNA helicase HerA-like ATPase
MSGAASSIDGRTFEFEAPLSGALPIGSYVRLDAGDESFLGQVLHEAVRGSSIGGAATEGAPQSIVGHGLLLAQLGVDGPRAVDGTAVFGQATMDRADSGIVNEHFAANRGKGASLALGTIQRMPDVPAMLRASGFGRHTFLCGQSGSGKTYTLGLVLERLLLETDIRIGVIDPNSDYVNLATLRPQADTGLDDDGYRSLTERHAAVASGIHVFRGEGSAKRLTARYGRLSLEQQTMVLGIDPVRDPEEYNAFLRTVRTVEGSDYGLEDLIEAVRASFDDDVRRLGLRIDNLGIAKQSIWAGSSQGLVQQLPDDWRMIVADVGSLPSRQEVSIASAAMLGFLWEQRHARRPMIIVIDEAHNVCPQNPTDPNQALATEHVVRIAGEGRKYGLYLFLSTQRPSKVHQNVLSQCDNLMLMKMNSVTDIRTLSETFSYAPASLVERAASFGLGEGLAAGKIAPDPLLFKSGSRITLEGGGDVPSSWAQAR